MPKLYTDEVLDGEVLFVIRQHRGKQNAIGRWELVERLFGRAACEPRNDQNTADRDIRDSVSRLRKRGVLICDMGDGAGRYIASTVEEYQAFRLRYGSGAFDVMETLREMDKAAAQEWPNPLQQRLL